MCVSDVHSSKVKSPFGLWKVEGCKEGLHRLSLVEMVDLDLSVQVDVEGAKDSAVYLHLEVWMFIL